MFGYDDDIFGSRRRESSYYDTMQVCLNGHQITAFYDTSSEGRMDYRDPFVVSLDFNPTGFGRRLSVALA